MYCRSWAWETSPKPPLPTGPWSGWTTTSSWAAKPRIWRNGSPLRQNRKAPESRCPPADGKAPQSWQTGSTGSWMHMKSNTVSRRILFPGREPANCPAKPSAIGLMWRPSMNPSANAASGWKPGSDVGWKWSLRPPAIQRSARNARSWPGPD
ncbi:hypothetical protein D3C75_757740 [compost metagenome]